MSITILEDNNQILTIKDNKTGEVYTELKHEFLTKLTGRVHEKQVDVWTKENPYKRKEPGPIAKNNAPINTNYPEPLDFALFLALAMLAVSILAVALAVVK